MSAFGWVFAMVYLTNKQGKGQCCRGLFKAIRLLPQTPTAGPISFFRTDCVIIWYKSRRISSWYRMRNYSRDLLTATIWNIVRPIRSSKIIETVHRREKYCFANFKKRKEKRKEKRLWRWIAPSIRYKLSLVLSKQRYCSTINPVYEFIYFDVILERREWWCIERDKLAACKCQKCNLRKMNKPPVTIFQRRPIRVRCDRAVGSPPLEIPLSPSVNSSVSRELFRQQVPTLI